jgi:hypothetical protein
MALKSCPECGNEVSSTAFECPKCGFVLRDKLYVQIFKFIVKLFLACLFLQLIWFVLSLATMNRN